MTDTEEKLRIVVRYLDNDDWRFIYDSWCKANHYMGLNKFIPDDYFNATQSQEIDRLRQQGAQVVLACKAEDPGYIYGWCCFTKMFEETVINYIYVKTQYREKGIASFLLDRAGVKEDQSIITTHLSFCIYFKDENNKNLYERRKIVYLPGLDINSLVYE